MDFGVRELGISYAVCLAVLVNLVSTCRGRMRLGLDQAWACHPEDADPL